MDVHGELEWRGLIYDATDGTRQLLARERVSGYIGFDPTASSLHVGNLLVIMALVRLQRAGHAPLALVGGGTGLIGDPSGKTAERLLLTPDVVATNVAGVRAQLERFLDFEHGDNRARLVDNGDWLTRLGAIEFMRDVGKHFTVNAMLAKDSVKKRIEGTDGISYTEFSYSLLQAYDFLELYRRYGCVLQMGGSDQWGNIVAGMDLIRRVESAKAYGLVMPLITTANGAKFGKTESGTIWLDAARTTPYQFYQFWLNTDDRDAVRYLKFFTLLDRAVIDDIDVSGAAAPEKRLWQRELAREMTRLVHGEAAVAHAEAVGHKLFSGDFASMSAAELEQVLADAPSIDVSEQPDGWRIQTLLVESGLATSMSEATRQVQQRAVQVNGRLFGDEKMRLTIDQAIEGKVFVLGKGKKERRLIRVVGGSSGGGS